MGRRVCHRLAPRPSTLTNPLGGARRHARRLPPTRSLHDPCPQAPSILKRPLSPAGTVRRRRSSIRDDPARGPAPGARVGTRPRRDTRQPAPRRPPAARRPAHRHRRAPVVRVGLAARARTARPTDPRRRAAPRPAPSGRIASVPAALSCAPAIRPGPRPGPTRAAPKPACRLAVRPLAAWAPPNLRRSGTAPVRVPGRTPARAATALSPTAAAAPALRPYAAAVPQPPRPSRAAAARPGLGPCRERPPASR